MIKRRDNMGTKRIFANNNIQNIKELSTTKTI